MIFFQNYMNLWKDYNFHNYSRDKKGTYPYYISPIEIGLL